MRLKLVSQTEPEGAAEAGWRVLERGEITIGRDPGCTWPLADTSRTVSSVHCRIVRDAVGFVLRDESANGVAVDGRDLAEGESARLTDGAVITFCGQRFQATITGDDEPDWRDPDARLALGDEAPSITAILADVAPVGRTATGILPGRLGDDWMDAGTARPTDRRTAPSPSRPEIGWAGPPDPTVIGRLLPDDWDAASDAGSRNEHVVATTTRVRLPRAAGPDGAASSAVMPQAEPIAADLLGAFLKGFGGPVAMPDDPSAFLSRMGRALREALDTLARMDAEARDIAAEQGVERPASRIALDGLGPAVAAAEEGQRQLVAAVRDLLRETDRLAPAALAARVGAAPASPASLKERLAAALPGHAEACCWQAYRAALDAQGAGGLRARFAARLQADPDDPSGADFEELSADRPRRGDAR